MAYKYKAVLALAGAACLSVCAAASSASASSSSSLKVLNTVGGGAFTFTLTTANLSVNTDNFWTGTYYVPPVDKSAPVAVYSASALAHADAFVPYAVLATNASVVTGDVLRQLVAAYEADDDVFTAGFLHGVQLVSLQPPSASVQIQASALDYLASLPIRFLVLSSTLAAQCSPSSGILKNRAFTTVVVPAPEPTTNATIAPGPYVAHLATNGQLSVRKVYALFSDYQEAFHNGVVANDDGSFSAIELWNAKQYAPLIPVPSRLYAALLDRAVYPLAGLRFGLKDLMPVRGLVLTGGSRAYARLYDTPAAETAPAIERLLGLGAVLLGRAKLTTFAYGAYAYQNMDYSYPWNIRADGFLGLSASSMGSAAAIAAYDQLDFTVGSDTFGSVRNPADRVGVYGLRPSWGSINLTKVIPSATSLDTLGVLARSASMVQTVMGAWQTAEQADLQVGAFSLPKKIFYPTEWFPVNTTAAQTLIDGWLANMTAAMGMQLVPQNVTALFQEAVAPGDTLANFTSSFGILTKYDNWHLFGKSFVADYQARFGGRAPEADNQVLVSWRTGQAVTAEAKAAAERKMAVFGDFVNSQVVPYSSATCTDGLWVYQIQDAGGGVPEYRDVLDYDYFPPFSPMRAASIAPYAQAVDVTVPIGVVPYDSVISLRREELVMTLNFVAHRGCDHVLMAFLAACERAGFCRPVKTGISAW